MKGRVIVLDMPKERGFAAALVQDGRLEDLILDPPNGTHPLQPGAIHKAKVTRKLPGKGGAFCAIGASEGFLRQAHGLKSGDTPLVQVVSLPEPGKAVAVTTRVLFKGPRLILTPNAKGINVSRQIRDEAEAERLRAAVTMAAQETDLPGDAGFIIRTSAKGEDETLLRAELICLARQYHVAQSHDERRLSGYDALTAALTEWLLPVPTQILCAPSLARVLAKPDAAPFGAMEFWGDDRFIDLIAQDEDPFGAYDLHEEIRKLLAPAVTFPGGSLIIEPTRALVAVDVNTGADFSPAAGLKVNLAAARELPRQLRLRGLGGQIAVDFAPMPKQHRRTLEEALKKAFRADPVETSLVGWTGLGLYELQRKRERRPLTEVTDR